ncbi:MAG: cyclase family protein, partial [Acidimicrobiaceae bacterium]|nr:cyclase family protein [Acidimicrobiaceae bacterium]
WAVHAAAWAFGVALVDNALLEPLSHACEQEGRYEFQLVVAPLEIPGGTGSPVNPLAIL